MNDPKSAGDSERVLRGLHDLMARDDDGQLGSLFAIGADRSVTYASPSAAPLLGVTGPLARVEEVVGMLHHEDAGAASDVIDGALAGATGRVTVRALRPDGEVRHLVLRATPARDPSGAIDGAIALATDVTARRACDAALVTARALLEAALDALPEQIAVLDESGLIVSVNRAWRAFGAAAGVGLPNDGVGSSYLAAIEGAVGPESRKSAGAAAGIREVLSGAREDFAMSYECDLPSGEVLPFDMRVVRVEGRDGGRRALVLHRLREGGR
jgi:PAS domain S-box-containing protein